MLRAVYGLCVVLVVGSTQVDAQGIALNGIGPINQSMGGASVAAPIDAAGALHWNPASISGLQHGETSFGATLALASANVTSAITAPFPLAGNDRSESGVAPIPYAAFVDRDPGSRFTYGLGLYGIGGFRANYPSSQSNPVLTPQPPLGVGVGKLTGEAELLQIVPTLSFALSERLSVGIAPTITLGRLTADPLLLAAPDDANGDSIATYPSGRGNRYSWGGGFQTGVYMITENCWHLGASIKSTQWFDRFRFKSSDELGRPRTVSLELEYPTIVSVGAAYSGFENILFAADVRHFGYGDASGLGESGFNPDLSVAGLGWRNIFAVAVGTQLRLTDRLLLRLGYNYNENPITVSQVSANVASPVITQHFLNVGTSYFVRDHWIFSLGYTHGFKNEIAGPIQTPVGPLPGSRVASEVSIDGLSMGITVRL